MMKSISHASLWGSALSVQNSCLLYMRELEEHLLTISTQSDWCFTAGTALSPTDRLEAAQRESAPAGGAVTQRKAQTDTGGGRRMLLMELHRELALVLNLTQSSQRQQQFITVEEEPAPIRIIAQGYTLINGPSTTGKS